MMEAGADIIFVEAPESVDEIRRIGQLPAPQVVNVVIGGKTPMLPREELGRFGFSLALYANAALQASVKAIQDVLTVLKSSGSLIGVEDRLASFPERQRVVRKDFYDTIEQRYAKV